MLILPIVNKNRVLNVELRLRNARKIKTNVISEESRESDIIVNRERFSNSIFKDSREENAPTEFIRAKSILYPRNFLVTTKTKNDSKQYDVYEVAQPPRKVNESLDKLYGKAITDLRKEIPGVKNRGRYVSFEKLGMDKYLTEDKINKLQEVIREERDQSKWPEIFEREGIADIGNTLDFINNFECTVVSDTTIPETSMQDVLKSLSIINTKDHRQLNKYYIMAQKNAKIYKQISRINKIMYDEPLTLIQSERQKQEQKQLVKKPNEVYKKEEKPTDTEKLISLLSGKYDERESA
ncbi:MAG: hypothetical protein IK137_04405 [Bacilli bacterium]|nr:hypothetical protein [Bacilli bacterium]